MEKPILQDSPSFVDLCTLHQHAMRYYRLWIYACNTVLALATLVFTVFAVSVLVDPRISLLTGVELYQPTFLYAYVALLLQCGVLQAIGCVGALRLNQRLLNTYWTLLLVLMIGDILVGLVWAFRLDHIKSNLRPMLKQKLVALYGKDEDFTETWDWVQTNDMCCGVDGPIDFQRINESTFGTFDTNGLANDTWATYLLRQQEMKLQQQQQSQQTIPKLPSTCCVFTVTPVTTAEPPFESPGGGEGGGRHSHHGYSKSRGNNVGSSSSTNNSKGDRWNINDPGNTKQGYYQQPQQLKGSFHVNSNPYFPESSSNLSSSSILVTSRSSISTGSSLVVSNLRQFPLTDPVPAAASGYFGTGAVPPQMPVSGVHNRRKISHAKNKHLDEYGYAERNRFGSRPTMTTTESPGGGRPPPITIGVCVLPIHLRQTPPAARGGGGGGSSGSVSSSNSNYNSMEHGSGSFEDMSGSSEYFSSTPNPSSSPPTTTTTESSTPGYSSSAEPPSSSSTPTPPTNSQSNRGSSNRPPYPFPFTVSMDQHTEGCGDKILEWVEHSSDVLFVIGFCIIVFLKGCFIAILRYEIKEMIEKIKLLNGEDAGRTAAMNELIGLTSMYESGNDDSGEREGLMSGVHGTNADTSNTNVDTIDGDNASAIPSSIGTTISRKDSIHFVKENHVVGNNVPPARYIGNHIGGALPATSPTTNSNIVGGGGGDDYPRVLAVTRESLDNANANITTNKHEIEEDFDSGSALLGNKLSSNDSPIGNNKYYQHHHHYHHHHLQYPHRNENGGRTLPRNGNNNNAISIENPPVGVPSSQSAPLPIDAIARVTNASVH